MGKILELEEELAVTAEALRRPGQWDTRQADAAIANIRAGIERIEVTMVEAGFPLQEVRNDDSAS